MLQRLRNQLIQGRLLAAVALCLLALQFLRFEHVHDETPHPAGQHCQVCSHVDRLGHAPPQTFAGTELRPATFSPETPAPRTVPQLRHYPAAQPRAPPRFS